jgi:hypothetical protein
VLGGQGDAPVVARGLLALLISGFCGYSFLKSHWRYTLLWLVPLEGFAAYSGGFSFSDALIIAHQDFICNNFDSISIVNMI